MNEEENDLDADDEGDVPREGGDPAAYDIELPNGLHEGRNAHHGDDPQQF